MVRWRGEGDGHLNWDQLLAGNTLTGMQSCRQTSACTEPKEKKKEKGGKKRQ